MDWSPGGMNRLFELYQQQFRGLRTLVIAANRSHGSSRPEKTWMEPLGREEFEKLFKSPSEPDIANRWVRRIIQGHEHEFPNAQVA